MHELQFNTATLVTSPIDVRSKQKVPNQLRVYGDGPWGKFVRFILTILGKIFKELELVPLKWIGQDEFQNANKRVARPAVRSPQLDRAKRMVQEKFLKKFNDELGITIPSDKFNTLTNQFMKEVIAKTLVPTDSYATKKDIKNFLIKQLQVEFHKKLDTKHALESINKILEKAQKEKGFTISIPDLLDQLRKQQKIEEQNKLIEMVEEFYQTALNTPLNNGVLEVDVYFNKTTSMVTFKRPKEKTADWQKGSFKIKSNAPLEHKALDDFDLEENGYFYGKIMDQLQILCTNSKNLGISPYEIIKKFAHHFEESEFDDYVKPNTPSHTPGTKVRFNSGDIYYEPDAHYVKLDKNQYIATKQPDDSEFEREQFWHMIATEQSPLIVRVMDPKNIEEKYWPRLDEEMNFNGGLQVKCVEEKKIEPNLSRRKFEIVLQGIKHTVYQIDYWGWPDGGIPPKKDMVTLLKHVEETQAGKKGPMTVHCHGGQGRTGTFITTHAALSMEKPNFRDLVMNIRKQRYGKMMVENANQYAFAQDVYKHLKHRTEKKIFPL